MVQHVEGMCSYGKHGLSDSKTYLQGKDDWRRLNAGVILVSAQWVSKQQMTAKDMLLQSIFSTEHTVQEEKP